MKLTRDAVARAGLLIGPGLALAAYWLLPARAEFDAVGLSPGGRATAVFSSGYVSVPEMARTGLWLNFVATAVVTVVAYFGAGWVTGVQP